jgi:hypothetical protein
MFCHTNRPTPNVSSVLSRCVGCPRLRSLTARRCERKRDGCGRIWRTYMPTPTPMGCGSTRQIWSRRPRVGSMPCIARVYKPSARNSPPTSPPLSNSASKNWQRRDASRPSIRIIPRSIRRWPGRTRRSPSCLRASCACPPEGSGPRCYCRRRRSIRELTCAGRS